jgi:hypothetical protein
MDTPVVFAYSSFGLTVRSEFEIPELDAARAADEAEVRITMGVGNAPAAGIYCPRDDTPPSVVVLAGAGRTFRISDGCAIEVWEDPGTAREITRAGMLGAPFATMLYQRGMWPLHVGGSLVHGRAWLFSGRSGAGKSTLVSWLNANAGLPVVADDAAVISFQGAMALVAGGLRTMRLMPDAFESTGAHAAAGSGAVSTLPATDHKIRVRLPARHFDARLPVAGLVWLSEDDDCPGSSVSRLTGTEAFLTVQRSLYRPWPGARVCTPGAALSFCSEFVSRVPVYAFKRRRGYDLFSPGVAPLLRMMQDNACADVAGVAISPEN